MSLRGVFHFALILLSADLVVGAAKSYKSSGRIYGECVKGNFTDFEMCKGPKSTELAEGELKMIYDSKGHARVVGSYKLMEDASSITTEARMYMLENNQYKKLWNTQENNVCRPNYDFISDIMKMAQIDKTTCTIKKTDHQEVDMDLVEIFYKVNQGKSVYGSYKFDVLSYTPTGNLFCIRFIGSCERE